MFWLKKMISMLRNISKMQLVKHKFRNWCLWQVMPNLRVHCIIYKYLLLTATVFDVNKTENLHDGPMLQLGCCFDKMIIQDSTLTNYANHKAISVLLPVRFPSCLGGITCPLKATDGVLHTGRSSWVCHVWCNF